MARKKNVKAIESSEPGPEQSQEAAAGNRKVVALGLALSVLIYFNIENPLGRLVFGWSVAFVTGLRTCVRIRRRNK